MQQNAIPLHRVFHGIDLRLTRLVVAMTINFFLRLWLSFMHECAICHIECRLLVVNLRMATPFKILIQWVGFALAYNCGRKADCLYAIRKEAMDESK